MYSDMFSSFDDHNQVVFNFFVFVWLFVFVFVLALMSVSFPLGFWGGLFTIVWAIVYELVSRSKGSYLGGSFSLFGGLFVVFLFFNLLGLVPYVFSLTSHFAVNLIFSLPLWFSIILASSSYDLGSFLSHLQPLGAPEVLSPFLCVVELVSMLVRPMTLGFRLTANLSTGHIMMSLLGLGFVSSGSFFLLFFIFSLGVFYFIFEMGVCFVQGYIFTLLPVLYVDEHPES